MERLCVGERRGHVLEHGTRTAWCTFGEPVGMHAEDRLEAARIDPVLDHRTWWWEGIPVIGWIVGNRRWMRAARPIAREIDAVLVARDPIPIETWGDDPVIQRCAEETLRAIREEMSWESDRFRPDDDAAIVFWSWLDALDFAGVIVMLEGRLGVAIPDEAAVAMTRGTLGTFVSELAERVRANPA